MFKDIFYLCIFLKISYSCINFLLVGLNQFVMSGKSNITVLGVGIYDRIKEAGEVQNILTKFGCSIKTRIGLHEVTDEFCSNSGLIILELYGSDEQKQALEYELTSIEGVNLQKMVFAY